MTRLFDYPAHALGYVLMAVAVVLWVAGMAVSACGVWLLDD